MRITNYCISYENKIYLKRQQKTRYVFFLDLFWNKDHWALRYILLIWWNNNLLGFIKIFLLFVNQASKCIVSLSDCLNVRRCRGLDRLQVHSPHPSAPGHQHQHILTSPDGSQYLQYISLATIWIMMNHNILIWIKLSWAKPSVSL